MTNKPEQKTTFSKEYRNHNYSYRCNICGQRMIFGRLSVTWHAVKHWFARKSSLFNLLDGSRYNGRRKKEIQKLIDAYNHSFDEELELKEVEN